jgi:hypothetical protein
MPQIDFDGANSLVKTDKIQGQSGTTVALTAGHTITGFTSTGIDDNASGATAITISADEEVTMPLQPAFLVYPTSNQANVTGNGTAFTCVYGTEVYDIGSNFASNTFTAPITGKYILTVSNLFSGITSSGATYSLNIITSNRTYLVPHSSVGNLTGQHHKMFTVVADMDASDTAYVSVTGAGESGDVWDWENSYNNTFSGALLA